MEMGLRGRTALITGASRGIGRACAVALAREGCHISISARGDEHLEKTAADIRDSTSVKVYAQTADLGRPEDLRSLVDNTVRTLGRLDILVAIGGSPRRGSFEALTDDDLLSAFEVTVLSLARLIRLVVPEMRKRKWGRVVTVQSRSIRETIPNLCASNSTRPGAGGLIKNMSLEYAREGILFNTIVPGRIDTDRFRGGAAFSTMSNDDYVTSQRSEIPVGRLGTPEDIANAVTFLASESASYISGVALPVDGGLIRGI